MFPFECHAEMFWEQGLVFSQDGNENLDVLNAPNWIHPAEFFFFKKIEFVRSCKMSQMLAIDFTLLKSFFPQDGNGKLDYEEFGKMLLELDVIPLWYVFVIWYI